MPINTSLNIDPYFDDFDISKKYYRVLFKPRFAVQARELTQLQTTLQNQIEQFGDNIYKEGSIIKGCNFTELRNLNYVKVVDGINPLAYIERTETVNDVEFTYYYELENENGLKALIITAAEGFQSRAPNLNTFFINYLNTSNSDGKTFGSNEILNIREYVITTQEVNGSVEETVTDNGIVEEVAVASFSNPVGRSFGLSVSEGVVFQKGHFLFSDEQTIVVSKYVDGNAVIRDPNNISVGYIVDEEIVSSQQDTSLLDNANGSPNENAPGADRLKLSPRLVGLDTTVADNDPSFFALLKYENGSAVQIRNVSQFNSISNEMARRTFETNGDYIVKDFDFGIKRRLGSVVVTASPGIVYSKGYRVENKAERTFTVEEISENGTKTQNNQPLSFDYGGYCPVLNANGVIDVENFSIVRLLDTNEDEIGNAVVKNFVADKIYLFAIRMDGNNNFSSVRYVKKGTGSTGKIEITPTVIDSTKSTLIFDTGMFSTKEITDMTFNVRRQKDVVTINSSGNATVEPSPNETFNSYTLKDILVVNQNFENVDIISSEITQQGNLYLTLDDSNVNATVYYNAQISPNSARVKQTLDVYVKTTFQDGKEKYTLGIPDGCKILEVKDSNGVDYTESFRLYSNQKNNFYDHSFMAYVGGRKKPSDNTLLTVKVKVFKVDFSQDFNFFTINSYPNIPLDEIPYFEDTAGKVFDMRDCIDFRPYRRNIANYSTNESGATIIASNASVNLPEYSEEIFDVSLNYVVPAIRTSGSVDIEYFLNRTDALVVDSYGVFDVIKGKEGVTSAPPPPENKTTIAEIYIPGFPALTQEEASVRRKPSYAIKVKRVGINNFTMKEINDLSENISKLIYYASLSALESSTQNLLIKDDQGNNRFKNGIMVDPFNDLSIANMQDPEFNASVDFTEKSLAPSVKTIPFNLIFKSADSSSVQVFNDKVITLAPNLAADASAARIISQPYATNFRTCTSNFYEYRGTGELTPEYDAGYNTSIDPIQIDLDLATPFADLVDGINEFVPLTSTTTNLVSRDVNNNTTTRRTGGLFGTGLFGKTRRTTTSTTTSVFEDVTRTLQVLENTREQQIGDFVTNFEFRPYMRSRDVQVSMFGLRPNTRHYFFFDEDDVNEFVAPGTLRNGTVVRSGEYGVSIRSDENGAIFAIFSIPEERFFVGDRELTIADVDDFESIESASSSFGSLIYRAYNFNVDKAGLTLSTREPEIDIEEVRTTRTVVTRNVQRQTRRPAFDPGGGDPLAQTFFIKDNLTNGADCAFASSVDLYFKRRSQINGVTIMIREVVNGYPSQEILPFSKVHLTPQEVNVSEDGSVRTNITFNAPVRLDAEKEYAIVIQPDANDPDYLVFTSKVGGTNLSDGSAVVQDWGDGVLFTSTNNRAWESYQDEDIKFSLYRYNFNASSGVATFETDNHEFFTLTDTTGRFAVGERAYAFKGGSTTYNVSVTSGSDVVTGTGLNVFNVGDFIYVENVNGNINLLKVESTANDELTVEGVATFTGNFAARRVVVGNVAYFDRRKPDFIVLESSSARSGNVFSDGDKIYGLTSGAEADIVSVDDYDLSYVQPMINRTVDTSTNITMTAKVIDPDFPENIPYDLEGQFGKKIAFNENGCLIRSKSNDTNLEKNLKIQLTLENNGFETTTPFVDLETAMVFTNQYNISNDSATTSRYVSNKVQLSEGFTSEDFRLYTTAYRPNGTDVKVYLRILNESDPSELENNDWFELEMTSNPEIYSSSTNLDDFKEYIYEIPASMKDVDGIVEYTNQNGTFTGYRTFGIKIELRSNDVFNVPRLLDYRGVSFE